MAKWLTKIVFLVIGFSLSHQGWAAPEYKVFLTAKENSGVPLSEPTTEFACSDKIYAVVEVNDPELKGQNTTKNLLLQAVWRDPHQQDREHTEYNFSLFNGHARVWVWLKLNRSSESALVQFINPSAGMDEFIGEWQLRLKIDGELIDKRKFAVLC